MLSVIFVPIICIFLIIVLYFLLNPRRRQDAPAAAQYQLKRAIKLIDDKSEKISKKDLSRIDITVNKAKGFISRAKLEEIYDMNVPFEAATKAREITQAILIANPDDPKRYLDKTRAYLTTASNYIVAYCGVTNEGAGMMSLNSFNHKAKQEKAKKHLTRLDDDE